MWRSSCGDTVAQWWGRKRKSITREPRLAAETADVQAELNITLAAVLIACPDCPLLLPATSASIGVCSEKFDEEEEEQEQEQEFLFLFLFLFYSYTDLAVEPCRTSKYMFVSPENL